MLTFRSSGWSHSGRQGVSLQAVSVSIQVIGRKAVRVLVSLQAVRVLAFRMLAFRPSGCKPFC